MSLALHPVLLEAAQQGRIRWLDAYFAQQLGAWAGEQAERVMLLAALVSQQLGEGHSCLLLDDLLPLARYRLPQWAGVAVRPVSGLPLVLAGPGQGTPLVLDAGRVYLARYWDYENGLAQRLKARVADQAMLDLPGLSQALDRYFPPSEGIDYQRLAAALAALKSFCVISGGPGTGKTRTLAAILALLLDLADGKELRIGLAAPTGKAAARMTESLGKAKLELGLTPELAARLPEQASTLHLLLGLGFGRVQPKFDQTNPLPLDVLVVDEASMIDLPMMAKLLAAVPRSAKLILLGDKDQLASVEAGRVLADICGDGDNSWSDGLRAQLAAVAAGLVPQGADQSGSIQDAVVVLQKTWRFEATGQIGQLAQAARAGDAAAFMAAMEADPGCWHPAEPKALAEVLTHQALPIYRQLMQADQPEQALALLEQLRVLCALNEGSFGVAGINQWFERQLRPLSRAQWQQIYHGQPIILSRNDHAQQLYNGDTGILWQLPEGAWFAYLQSANGVRAIPLAQLPPHQTLYALSIHKSQGSEFERLILVLPPTDAQHLTRELLYTGITRAKQRLSLVAEKAPLSTALKRQVQRGSGLGERLGG